MNRIGITALSAIAVLSSVNGLSAQTEFDRIDERFEQPRVPLAQPGSALPAFDPLDAPPEAEAVTFQLGGIRFVGNTVVDTSDLQPLYDDLVGEVVPVTAVFALANSVTAFYGQRGFPLSRAIIPAQEIGDDGVVTIRIVEGFIDQVVIDDPVARENQILAEHGQRLTEERPISSGRLERELLLADDLPGLRVRSVLRRSEETPGATTIILDTEEEPRIAYGFTIDNRGTDAIGPWQVELRSQFNNLLHSNSQTRLRFANASLSRELLFADLEHEAVLNARGLRLLVGLRGSRAQPGTETFRAIELDTRAVTGFAELRYPAIRSRNRNLEVFGRLEARNTRTTALGVPLSRDRIRSVRIGLDFDDADEFGGLNTASLKFSKGLTGLGANSNDDPLNSRADGRVDYVKANLDLSRTQQLGAFSDNLSSWSLFGQIRGQFTGRPLLSSEECVLGGSELGRAFDPSTLAGDRCFAVLAEVRYQVPNTGFLDSLQLYAFADTGRVSDVAGGSSRLSSAGLGARFAFAGNYRGSVEINRQLRNTGGGIDSRSPRLMGWPAPPDSIG